MDWIAGTRVRVVPHAFWPEGVTGTVQLYPSVAEELAGGANGCSRDFKGARGPLTFVWVVFDRAIRDGDNDGPYREGEILSEYLIPE